MPMPTTTLEASAKGWGVVTKPTLHRGYEKLDLWCLQNDYTLCLLYDDTGYIAGLQIAFDPAKYNGAVFDWTTVGFTSWSLTVDGVTTEYKVTHQYYVSPETLELDAADRIAARKEGSILQDQHLFLQGFYGGLYNVSTNVAGLKSETEYTKQACIPAMGNHYYYNMTTNLPCGADTIFNWFPLEYKDQLVGVGFLIPGKYTVEEGNLYPFEDPDRSVIKMIVPTGPECLWNYGEIPGVTTMHTYFIKDAYFMTC
ncbi:uncharacterized protein LOC142981048 [Anticarsia gemmatalis]|uniref:uncharacterized protein LOC142981048 n=1 Tax=Anticarsia gemmatalis TaxID=129554 RepID=UPI003F765DBC